MDDLAVNNETVSFIKNKKGAGRKKRFEDPVTLTFKIERELRDNDKVADMFAGETSNMLRAFLEEAVKDGRIVVLTLKSFL